MIVGRAVPFCASGDGRLKVYAASIRELLHCVIIDAVLVNPYADDVMRIMCCFESGFLCRGQWRGAHDALLGKGLN